MLCVPVFEPIRKFFNYRHLISKHVRFLSIKMLSAFRHFVPRTKTLRSGITRLGAHQQSGSAMVEGKTLEKDWRGRAGAIVAAFLAAAGYVKRDDIRDLANLYVWKTESKQSIVDTMCEVFENGGVAGWDANYGKSKNNIIERPDELELLGSLLSGPADTEDGYTIVLGATGTGKTTAFLNTIRTLNRSVKGVVYFRATESPAEFATGLGGALGFRTPTEPLDAVRTPSSAAAPSTEPEHTWGLLKPQLAAAASAFSTKHQRPAVLVLDAMDLIAKHKPGFFTKIQQFAKHCADDGLLHVIFVFSDGTAPLVFSDSSSSRVNGVIEIGDISDEKAVAYLMKKKKLDQQRASNIVTRIAGGRFALLNSFAKRPESVDDLCRALNEETENVLVNEVKVPPSAKLFRALVSSPTKALGMTIAHQLEDMGKVKLLLQNNILAHHPNHTYTFHNRHVERFVRAKVEAAEEEERKRKWWPW